MTDEIDMLFEQEARWRDDLRSLRDAWRNDLRDAWHDALRDAYHANTLGILDDRTAICPTCCEAMEWCERGHRPGGKACVHYLCNTCGYGGEMAIKPDRPPPRLKLIQGGKA